MDLVVDSLLVTLIQPIQQQLKPFKIPQKNTTPSNLKFFIKPITFHNCYILITEAPITKCNLSDSHVSTRNLFMSRHTARMRVTGWLSPTTFALSFRFCETSYCAFVVPWHEGTGHSSSDVALWWWRILSTLIPLINHGKVLQNRGNTGTANFVPRTGL